MRLPRLAWLTLGWNVAVILWGAFVRASGSGAGCGAHWPLCNGEVVPRAPALATLVELTHRLTSGVALLLVFYLAYRLFRERPAGHPGRQAAAASVVFILTGRIEGGQVPDLEAFLRSESSERAIVLELGGVKLVDRDAVQFLASREAAGTELVGPTGEPRDVPRSRTAPADT